MEKIKAVIFDLDGTLANTLPLCIEAFRRSIEPLINHSISDAEIIATFGPSEEGTIMALAPNHYKEGIAAYLHFYKELHAMCPRPFDGIKNLLNILKENGVYIAIVTGKGKLSTAISLQYFGLETFFEIVETGSPMGPRKVEGIQKILSQLQRVGKEQVIYVGDAASDIIASRQAGVSVIAAAWATTSEPENLQAQLPDEIFYSVDDFTDWLNLKL